ncbi:MAG TPA: SGNH/GDSL hydrolase family protein [Tepidisphaeraceae bacterium]|jgi:lysophospholipase L1-like esterase|nr:SGNH/GDSL hydrolase family protein [Tepidisphaeraceae bacterium]
MTQNEMSMPRVFVVGASLTLQFGPYLERELAGRMHYDRKRATDGKRAEDNLDVAQGASGGDSSRVLAYLKDRRQNDPIPADILLLSCGLHDLKTHPTTKAKQVPIEQFESNLRAITQEVAAMGLTLAWLRITPVVDEIHNARASFHRYQADVDRYNAIADGVMRDADAHVIDFAAFCQALLPESLIDHVHYDEAARARQAKFIAEHLLKIAAASGDWPATTALP